MNAREKRYRRWFFVLSMLLIVIIAVVASAGPDTVRRVVLFAGDTDSTTQVSKWIDCKDAYRIYVRTFSTHAGFGNNADTTKVDSLATVLVVFTDSLTVSGGTVAGLDTVQLAGVSAVDSVKAIAMMGMPQNKQLRGAGNGWGIWSKIYPTTINGAVLAASNTPADEIITPRYVRLRETPVRRSTGATVSATVPNRTNGLRGFRQELYIWKKNFGTQ